MEPSLQLYHAVSTKKLSLVQQLLQEGADINMRLPQARGSTALHVAINSLSTTVVRLLIDSHADVHALDEYGDDPLTALLFLYSNIRCQCNLLEAVVDIAKLLLQAGAVVSADALAAAAQLTALQVQQQHELSPSWSDGQAFHGLPSGVSTSADMLLQQLVAAAGSIDLQDSRGKSALGIAVRRCQLGAVQMLLSAGAAVGTALHAAVLTCNCCLASQRPQHMEIVQLLAAAAAMSGGVNATDADGRTPLLVAVQSAPAVVVRAVLSAGADPNKCSPNGEPPLHCAVQKCCTYGRRREAEPDSAAPLHPTDDHQNALEVVHVLLEAGADPNAAWHLHRQSGTHAAAATPAECHAGADQAGDDGAEPAAATAFATTPLETAAAWGSPDLVAVLLKAGARSSVQASGGALARACIGQQLGVVKLLLASAHGCPTISQVEKALTTMGYACNAEPSYLPIITYLLLHLHRAGSNVPAAIAGFVRLWHRINKGNASVLQLAMLQSWAADTAAADAEHAALAAAELDAAAVRRDAEEMLLGIALVKKQAG